MFRDKQSYTLRVVTSLSSTNPDFQHGTEGSNDGRYPMSLIEKRDEMGIGEIY